MYVAPVFPAARCLSDRWQMLEEQWGRPEPLLVQRIGACFYMSWIAIPFEKWEDPTKIFALCSVTGTGVLPRISSMFRWKASSRVWWCGPIHYDSVVLCSFLIFSEHVTSITSVRGQSCIPCHGRLIRRNISQNGGKEMEQRAHGHMFILIVFCNVF
jgi:hypothetical protein